MIKCLKNLFNKQKIRKESDIKHKQKTVCLIVPHSKKKKGAYSKELGHHEYTYINDFYEKSLVPALMKRYIQAKVIKRDGLGIVGAYREALKYRPCMIMEWHFNAFNGKARGFEILFKEDLAHEVLLAQNMLYCLLGALGTKKRGLRRKLKGERGFVNVSQTSKIPSLLLEPFFGDNSEDALNFHEKREILSNDVAEIIEEYIQSQYIQSQPLTLE